MNCEWRREPHWITTDKARLDVGLVHRFLAESYWAKGIPRDVVERSIEHSMCFGVFHAERQVGFARVVTDCATFAWIGDVFVLEEARGRGLAKWLIEVITTTPELQGLRRWMLATRDAHGLYSAFAFEPLRQPDRFMERWVPEIYQGNARA